MIRLILSIILLLSAAGNVFAADKAVVFKCLNKNRYEVYLNLQDDYRADSSMLGSISRQLLRGFFSIDRIPDKYYSVEKIDNISYFGFDITQYTVIPKDKDRFSLASFFYLCPYHYPCLYDDGGALLHLYNQSH